MADPVEVSVRSALGRIIDELDAIRKKSDETSESFKQGGDAVADGLKRNVRDTETFFGQLTSLGRRVADQLRGDFKSLISLNALQDALKLSGQFRSGISETVALSDAIRKLGTTFGLSGKEFVSFQTQITKGLGDIGMSSDVAVRALEGLSHTPVRGNQNLIGYTRTSGQLASIGREQGKEGDIAQSLARVIQARGGDVNDPKQVLALAESVRKILVQTGQSPSQSLQTMERLFAQMPEDLRKTLTSTALTNLTAAGAVAGPNSTKFLEEYLGKSPIARLAFDAQGGKGIISDKGIDTEKFGKFAQGILSRVGGDPRLAAQTLGLSEEAAEGFVRMAESIARVRDAQENLEKVQGSLNEQYRSSMGLGESFKASINKVKSALATPLSAATNAATNFLGDASQTTGGALGIAAGGVGAAALLGGFGARGLGRTLGGGLVGTVARGAAAEQLTGKETIPVYVTNAGEIGGSLLGDVAGGAAAGGGGLAGLLGPLGLLLGAGMIGYGVKKGIDSDIDNAGKDTTAVQYSPEMLAIFKKAMSEGKIPEGRRQEVEKILRDQDPGAWRPALPGGDQGSDAGSTQRGRASDHQGSRSGPAFPGRPQKVVVELNTPLLKASVQPTRGATN
jgi:hypothetical protein